jgi:hypothetical protein
MNILKAIKALKRFDCFKNGKREMSSSQNLDEKQLI